MFAIARVGVLDSGCVDARNAWKSGLAKCEVGVRA